MLSDKLTYVVRANIKDEKLRDYLKYTESLSGRFIKSSGLTGKITVNNKVAKLNHRINSEDIIEIDMKRDEHQNIEPEKMDLDVVYDDIDLIVVNKSPGIVVHPTRGYPNGTLANGVLYYFKERGEKCIVRLVSRLDMDTSGLIIIAKNQYSHMALARDMQSKDIQSKDNDKKDAQGKTFEKSYMAVVHGNMQNKSGTIDLPIGKPDEESINRKVCEEGQRSITHYEVVESFKNGDLVKVTLETGRTHQIRVHFSHIGHPLYGDSLYGTVESDYIDRQALHAYKLIIPHPRTGEQLIIQSKLPDDINNLVRKLKAESDI
ncbi:RluA family pseudouridine synthase [Clostridium algoriphilum]|uniref:RluA family pseudouridine synthase n=1 Tax=Clostridium algoriphilum TaxID=198347 RepID=UPI001CF23D24|nr:RluA family pseudouridine synthase [Clostridium algoriphilum]MCB2292539.1 RluA family pseudouridine synthase [Clostridium algoriphilum]